MNCTISFILIVIVAARYDDDARIYYTYSLSLSLSILPFLTVSVGVRV